MKTNRLLRVLSLLGFLLLFAPFYDACDGNYIHKVNNDGTGIRVVKSSKEKIYDTVIDEDSFNGFQIASFTIGAALDTTFTEFKTEISKFFQKDNWYKELDIFISLLFDFTVLISFSLLILSFVKKQKLFTKLALANCILVIITFGYIVLLESSFEHWRQIKWGYYAFIITNLLLFYYSKKNQAPS